MSAVNAVLERVRKLFRHAESAGELGNQAEAEAFAAKANELLIQHKLDAAMLDYTEDQPEEAADVNEYDPRDLFGTKTATGWRSVLLNVVTKAHFCRAIRLSSGRVAVVGAKSDRDVAMYLIDQLLRIAPKLAAKAIPEPLSHWHRTTRRDRNAWLMGFASGVGEKLRQAREAVEQNPHALVVLNTANAKTDVAFRQAFPQTQKARSSRFTGSADAYAAGKAAGRSHSFTHGVRGGSAASRVTGGALRLGSGS